jgi:hypothetical protein
MCNSGEKKANRVLGTVSRTITPKTPEVLGPLYTSLVRPNLEYCIAAWSPYRKKDIILIEGVLRRATKMIAPIRDLPYPDRIRALDGLPWKREGSEETV